MIHALLCGIHRELQKRIPPFKQGQGTLRGKRRYSANHFKRLAHAVWECKYHVIWCPKYRFKILQGDIGRSMLEVIRQLCKWKKIEILEGNIQIDHIHLALSVPSKYSISEAAGSIKGKSTIKIFNIQLELKKRYWGRHFWAKG
ncbi:MAG: IS200/IS605 family transposase [Desulfobacterales bacterium]